ncbi:hypothetical protein QY049_33995 [Bradyrhizobium sp. WYCCWR 13022]|nr:MULTISPECIES: hypothetical protein [Bradyrhizobium]MDN4988187.1 hypothetical protein [Bradyrhizobium sp. WYCCWR 13022]
MRRMIRTGPTFSAAAQRVERTQRCVVAVGDSIMASRMSGETL